KLKATEYQFQSTKAAQKQGGSSASDPVRLYAMVFELEPDLEVALVFNGPADSKKWSKWERGGEEIARTLRRLEAKEEKPAPSLASGASMRDVKRAQIPEKLKASPKWKLYETDHYFLVTNNDDKAFLDELMGRLEAIHAIYEQDYPPDRAKELRAIREKTRTGSDKAEPDEPEGDGPAAPKG